jgi:hypothetical protein
MKKAIDFFKESGLCQTDNKFDAVMTKNSDNVDIITLYKNIPVLCKLGFSETVGLDHALLL